MQNSTIHHISLGAVALFVLALSAVVAVVHRTNRNHDNLDLPFAHKELVALPPGAENTIRMPHELRGNQCHACHPVREATQGAYSGLAKMPARQTWGGGSGLGFRQPAGRGAQGGPGGSPGFFSGAQAAMALSPPSAFGMGDTGGTFPPGTAVAQQTGAILSPAQQNAAGKIAVEGHWLGMETVDLTAALRTIYKIPAGVTGVIVDEVTLESAEMGLLAGDVVTHIGGRATGDLRAFFEATLQVADSRRTEVRVYRFGSEKRLTLAAVNAPKLGFASMEAAQPIRPGALSPHRVRSQPCTACHVIMATGGQLPVDAGDIVPTPPPIAANAKAPHAYRGVCNSCHAIVR